MPFLCPLKVTKHYKNMGFQQAQGKPKMAFWLQSAILGRGLQWGLYYLWYLKAVFCWRHYFYSVFGKTQLCSLEGQQRYFSYRAILVAIAQNSACFYGDITQLSHNVLQNGVSHRCVCVKLRTKGGVSHHFGGAPSSLKKYRAIWGIAAIVSQHRAIWALSSLQTWKFVT